MVDKINATFEAEDMDTFIKASQLIFRSDIHQAGAFVNEMLMMHPILAFNPVTKHLDVIESVHINGGSIQMDIEEYEVAKIEEKTKECNCDCVKNLRYCKQIYKKNLQPAAQQTNMLFKCKANSKK